MAGKWVTITTWTYTHGQVSVAPSVSVGNPTNALWPLTDENLRDYKGHLEGLPRLTTLDLRNTLITDAGLEHIAGLKQLDCLHLSSTSIRGDGLQHFENLTNLWMLSLDHTQVTDASLNHLRGLHRVQFLDLSDTKVTDEVVKKLQQALPNCKITADMPTAGPRRPFDRRERAICGGI